MSRFSLVLADNDEWYVDSLGKFLSESYRSKFSVSLFTKREPFLSFLDTNRSTTDIILVSLDMVSEHELKKYEPGMVAILSDGRLLEDKMQFPCINKYQPAEKIISQVIEAYSVKSSSIGSVVKGDKKTGLVSVFSPQGGSGNTTLSISLAVQYARMGLATLYVSLESVNAHSGYFNCSDNTSSLSNILLSLKDRGRNLAVRIDNAKCYDNKRGVYFFQPPTSPLELEEINEEDVNLLITGLREVGQFDMIVVDLGSVLSRRNLAFLSGSDSILLVLEQGAIGGNKLKNFEAELEKVFSGCSEEMAKKAILVFNKVVPGTGYGDVLFGQRPVRYKIPYLDDILTYCGDEAALNADGSIGFYIREAAREILSCSNPTFTVR